MSRPLAFCRFSAVLAASAAACTAGAAELESSALVLLRGQLEQSYNCDLAQILEVREVPIGQDVGLEGRVRCVDAREYDFSRQRAGQKFEIRLCQPTVC